MRAVRAHVTGRWCEYPRAYLLCTGLCPGTSLVPRTLCTGRARGPWRGDTWRSTRAVTRVCDDMLSTRALTAASFAGCVFGKEDGVHLAGMLAGQMYDGRRPPWTVRDAEGTFR